MAAEGQAALQEAPARATASPVAAPPASRADPGAETTAAAGAVGKGRSAKDKNAKPKNAKNKNAKAAKGKLASNGVDSQAPSVAAHPKAAQSVARAKGWGGLAGFLIAGYLSLPTSTLAEAGLRALIAGSVCYVAAWAGAVFVWRRLVMVELRNREERVSEL